MTGLSTELTLPSRAYQAVSKVFIRCLPCMPFLERYNHTICHEKQFVWFRVAKVGTRTIFDTFGRANVTLDAEHPMFCHYPVKLFKRYFKFAFVRNPWDRLVSCWHNKVLESSYFGFTASNLLAMQRLENFVDLVAAQDLETCDQHIRLQSKLVDLNNLDYLGRFEHFNEHLAEVFQIIGINPASIGQENASRDRSDYRQYYDMRMQGKSWSGLPQRYRHIPL